MRGTVTAWLVDGPCAGAFVPVEAIDDRPAPGIYFAAVNGRVVPMPRDDVTHAVLNAAGGRWHLYGRDGDEPDSAAWRYRALPPAAWPGP